MIEVRGTGKRALRDIILGVKDPRINIEFVPPNSSFVRAYQTGAEIATLHYKVGTIGITFSNCRVNRMTVTCRAGDIMRVTAEILGSNIAALASGCPWAGNEIETALHWIGTSVKVAPKSNPTVPVVNSKWHEWRYEIRNNIERLPYVDSKGTRSLELRHREVNGLLVWDFEDMAEFTEFVGSDAEDKFYLQILEGANYMLGSASGSLAQWGRLEAPHGPEDLILRRFPFTCIDIT